MSDFIPFDIQTEIISRLPAKSSVKSKLVSKRWNSYIGSSAFIIAHSGHNIHRQQPNRLLAWCKGPPRSLRVSPNSYVTIFDDKYVTVFDDVDTFYQQDFTPKAPRLNKRLTSSRVIDCCIGLVCLYDYDHPDYIEYNSKVVILWNPFINKCLQLPLPYSPDTKVVIGFGVCPVTFDPTVVKISNGNLADSLHWKVNVFTLSSGTWKTLKSSNLPRKTVYFSRKTVDLQCWHQCPQVVIDRFIYWDAYKTRMVIGNAEPQKVNLIVSFDMVTHEFEVIDFPNSLSHPFYINLSKIRESLAVVEYIRGSMTDICAVWVMEDIVTKSLTKLYTVKSPDLLLKRVLFFRKNGYPIMETHNDGEETAILEVYEPCSEHTSKLGINGQKSSFFVSSYVETLLLVDQEDCHIVGDSN